MKPAFKLTQLDSELKEFAAKTPQKILALWAIDCAERVLPYFEKSFPKDTRPRDAIKTLQDWTATGIFSMKIIRKASLDSHAAARDVGEDNPARSAARACGQAVATAHVSRHALGSAIYAQQAIFRLTSSMKEVKKERDWQYEKLKELRK
jgi:hypothetical protein